MNDFVIPVWVQANTERFYHGAESSHRVEMTADPDYLSRMDSIPLIHHSSDDLLMFSQYHFHANPAPVFLPEPGLIALLAIVGIWCLIRRSRRKSA